MNFKFIPFCLVLLCFSVNIVMAQGQLSKEEAERKRPEGVEPPKHQFMEAIAGKIDQARMEPPYWWVGMKNPDLEIMLYDQNIADYKVSINHPGVEVLKTTRLKNDNYLFVKVRIDDKTKPGAFKIALQKGKLKKSYTYDLKKRKNQSDRIKGINSSDLIYLIMPDRFANGNVSNDSFDNLNQTGIDRRRMFYRHGGDLQGIMDKLDYIKDLGITTIWLNPVQENNQPYESYHGYAITDFYNIDRRFGDNDLYKKFVDACHKKGIKVIMDIIHNHVGSEHWFIRDLPDVDWIHQWEDFTRTSYRATTNMDPYVSEADKNQFTNAWFDHHMPDLNQQQEQLATYLIQNNIWWVEYSGLDAFRIDTYAYPDQSFMSKWGAAMQKEYPALGLFAETWVHGPAIQAQFTEDNKLRKNYNSNMPAVTDFQMYYAINEALQKEQGWTEGIMRLYYTLAQDFLYEDPYRNVVFLDNHDLSRFFAMMDKDLEKFKTGISFLMTTRGIPMLYYGTEILMDKHTDPDGKVREDFPGGWKEDKTNKFIASGRSEHENIAFDYIKKLANYRKQNPVLHNGKLTQFIPRDGVYVYFRYNAEKTVMVVMNCSNEKRELKTDRFKERIGAFKNAKNIMTDELMQDISTLSLEKHENLILELK